MTVIGRNDERWKKMRIDDLLDRPPKEHSVEMRIRAAVASAASIAIAALTPFVSVAVMIDIGTRVWRIEHSVFRFAVFLVISVAFMAVLNALASVAPLRVSSLNGRALVAVLRSAFIVAAISIVAAPLSSWSADQVFGGAAHAKGPILAQATRICRARGQSLVGVRTSWLSAVVTDQYGPRPTGYIECEDSLRVLTSIEFVL